eukprot:3170201-Prymnesium_polylepis.1
MGPRWSLIGLARARCRRRERERRFRRYPVTEYGGGMRVCVWGVRGSTGSPEICIGTPREFESRPRL